jgi:hypothetical protein
MTDIKEIFDCTGFQWDRGNIDKNLVKHRVTSFECEQVFFNEPLLVVEDLNHSQRERRYYALGRTDTRRLLFVAFTVRNKLIRIISARDMSLRERKKYEEKP